MEQGNPMHPIATKDSRLTRCATRHLDNTTPTQGGVIIYTCQDPNKILTTGQNSRIIGIYFELLTIQEESFVFIIFRILFELLCRFLHRVVVGCRVQSILPPPMCFARIQICQSPSILLRLFPNSPILGCIAVSGSNMCGPGPRYSRLHTERVRDDICTYDV